MFYLSLRKAAMHCNTMNLKDRVPPPDTHVHLILLEDDYGKVFYLEIPIAVVSNLVVKPHKYLRYLGWCILGVKGHLFDEESNKVDLEMEKLMNGGTYIYIPEDPTLDYAVDLEVIKFDSEKSCSSAHDSTFSPALKMRDHLCAFTGLSGAAIIGIHIIPHARGNEWVNLILMKHPIEDDDPERLETIDDIRNSILVNYNIHSLHDKRMIAILKTPNPMMACHDVKPRDTDRALFDDVAYPSDTHFSLQWIAPNPDPAKQQINYQHIAANNLDAALAQGTDLPKPSGVLLHYNYGAAAVKHWGRNATILTNRAGITCPQKVAYPNSYKPPIMHSQSHNTEKQGSTGVAGGSQNLGRDGGHSGSADSDEWDEDDIMMFLWGNNPNAVARMNKEHKEKEDKINQWRSALA